MQSCSSNLNIFALCDIFAHVLVYIQVYMYTLVYILNCTACAEQSRLFSSPLQLLRKKSILWGNDRPELLQ